MGLTFEPQCRASVARGLNWGLGGSHLRTSVQGQCCSRPELGVGWVSPSNLSAWPVVPRGLNWGLGGSHLRACGASRPELGVGWVSPSNLSAGPVVPRGLNWGLGGSHLRTSVQGQWTSVQGL